MFAADQLDIAERVRRAYQTHLNEEGGFLPPAVPLDHLPAPFEPFLKECAELPYPFPAERGGVRTWLNDLFKDDNPAITSAIDGLRYMERLKLMTVLSILGHSFRWDTVPPRPEMVALTHLEFPAGLDTPWTHLAMLMNQPRVGTMWSLLLCNWTLRTKPGGAA